METTGRVVMDGNEAAARIAFAASEVVAIYPITPASPMGDLADSWSALGRRNLWDTVPTVIQMQGEGGAAGALHGALQAGALCSTFTASQGLLLMLPNMYKIAGELSPAVMHVAARALATHALSIFGDHSDVMAARQTGWAMLASSSVQAAHDLAAVAHAATLDCRVPFLHFFDGFRTSHELNVVTPLDVEDLRSLIDDHLVRAHRDRALSPDRPVVRGTAQNPDVYFQAREAVNPFYAIAPDVVQHVMDGLAARTGRSYHLFDYRGAPDAERVIVLMGSGAGAVGETVDELVRRGERVGLVDVRLYRPFSARAFVDALPETTRAIAVLDRAKEPGALGEPLYQDVVTALAEEGRAPGTSHVIGGRYGLASKEFDPAMAKAVFDELDEREPRRHFTVGIVDDVTRMSLRVDRSFTTESGTGVRAVFYGLGADGTVSANKSTVKIVAEGAGLYAQGAFVYDSKKAGTMTTSHLRFGPAPIESTYLIGPGQATFVACHQFGFLERRDVLELAAPEATFLLNSPFGPEEVWDNFPVEVQRTIIDKRLRVFVIDAHAIAAAHRLGPRVNTILQTCFFALTDLLDPADAVERIKAAIARQYGKRGRSVVQRNVAAVDAAVGALGEVRVPALATGHVRRTDPVPADAPDLVRRVTAVMMSGKGDRLPVSALPVDGTFPLGTARWEKRSIAHEIPIWDPDICIDCAKCALVCPHAAIRMKVYDPPAPERVPGAFKHTAWNDRDTPGRWMTIQVAPDDCTGCGVCVDVCPATSKEVVRHKAINMEPKAAHLDVERASWDFFQAIPPADRREVRAATIKGSQMLEPLFEASGACAGCGETPYLKLLTQLSGDRILVANATGCSSIYGGNLPTTPWSRDANGRGPAWSNSLFEDNAEFGLGMRLSLDVQARVARSLLERIAPTVGARLANDILGADGRDERSLADQRARVAMLRGILEGRTDVDARNLLAVVDALTPKVVWIVGGDGWAYDIGFGGLDHVLASGSDVNVLVLDTQVYSNTGGQASKATPRGAVAKFAAGGKASGRKDLGMLAAAYGDVYVAQVALGADNAHTIKAMAEAESWRGPSLVIAYSTCIEHGIDMSTSMTHQREAVRSGFWPLWRYDPRLAEDGSRPMRLDSKAPTIPVTEFRSKEARFAMLARSRPDVHEQLERLAQADVDERWSLYEQLAGVERHAPGLVQDPRPQDEKRDEEER